jgi:NADPH:quinone reductase-like Zn-dependent oxidoreductase
MLEGLFPHRFPLILGWDAAGTVAAVGAAVTEFQVGDKVYAYCRKPTALTSWQALFDAGQLKAGHSVLIHAGAGGTGGMAIQLAKHAGATVFTTASAASYGYVRSLSGTSFFRIG